MDATARLREEATIKALSRKYCGDCISTPCPHCGPQSELVRFGRELLAAVSPLRSTPQEGTTDELTRSVELAVNPPPQHAATDREDS